MLSVEEARRRLLKNIRPTHIINAPLSEACGFVLAKNLIALRDQPPFDASSMDGFAIHYADNEYGQVLKIIGESAAGHGYKKPLLKGECVRIFTGAPVPDGADTIIIQENALYDDNKMTIETKAAFQGQYVRPKGLDFTKNSPALEKRRILRPEDIAFAAALGYGELPIYQGAKIVILSLGDELKQPGELLGPDDIISSNAYGLIALAKQMGAQPIDLGIFPDDLEATIKGLEQAIETKPDIIITSGGASVGDHDYTKSAFENLGVELDFWKIAMRPGKPLMVGKKGDITLLGLPGNPVSSFVCSHLFLRPLINKMMQKPDIFPIFEKGVITHAINQNDIREDYLRAKLQVREGKTWLTAFSKQDSSMLSVLSKADALIKRAPLARAIEVGDEVEFLRLN